MTATPVRAGFAASPTWRSRRAIRGRARGRSSSGCATSVKSDDPFVTETARHLVDAGGKRFRPLLVLLAAQFGDPDGAGRRARGRGRRADPPRDALPRRRDGRGAAAARCASRANARWDNTVAILTGDFLFARASDILADLGPEAVRIQARTFERLVTGQIRETVGPARRATTRSSTTSSVLADKTGSLIATSGRFGAHAVRRAPTRSSTTADAVRRADRRRLPARRRPARRRQRLGRVRQDARHRPARGRPHAAGRSTRSRTPRRAPGCAQLLSRPARRRRRASPRRWPCCAPTRRCRRARGPRSGAGPTRARRTLAAAARRRGRSAALDALCDRVVVSLGLRRHVTSDGSRGPPQRVEGEASTRASHTSAKPSQPARAASARRSSSTPMRNCRTGVRYCSRPIVDSGTRRRRGGEEQQRDGGDDARAGEQQRVAGPGVPNVARRPRAPGAPRKPSAGRSSTAVSTVRPPPRRRRPAS